MLTFTIGAEQNILQEEFTYLADSEEEFNATGATFINTTIWNSTQFNNEAGFNSDGYGLCSTSQDVCNFTAQTGNYTSPVQEAPNSVDWKHLNVTAAGSSPLDCSINDCSIYNMTVEVSDDNFQTIKDSVEFSPGEDLAGLPENINSNITGLENARYIRLVADFDRREGGEVIINDTRVTGTFQTSEGNMNAGEGLVTVLPFIFGALLIGFLFKIMF